MQKQPWKITEALCNISAKNTQTHQTVMSCPKPFKKTACRQNRFCWFLCDCRI